jgi:hypothetical protein
VGSVNTVTSVLSKALQNPMKSGMEAPNGGCESKGDGHASLHVCVDLQDIRKCLTDIRGQLELGLKRVEVAFQMLEQKERMGREEKAGELGFGERSSRVKQKMGCESNNEVVGWSKPKKKNFRRYNKTQPGVLGPKPSKAPVQVSQGPRSTRSFPYRFLSRHPVQQPCQAGETSEMGVARATGVNGTMIAGDSSSEQPSGAEVLKPTTLASTREAEMDGEHNSGVGLGEESSTQMLVAIPEGAEDLGCELLTPVKSSKLSDSLMSLLSTIPKSDEVLGYTILSPVKSSKRLSNSSEYAGEVGFDSHTPGK